MITLSTICGRCCLLMNLQQVYKLSILMILFGLFATNILAQTVANIDIQPNTENEFYVADYQLTDAPQLGIAVSQDSYVYVFSIDTDLQYAQVFPNSFEANNYVYAAQGARYPSLESQYSFSLEGMQGFTTLFAIASPRAISDARLERYVQKYLLFAKAYSDPAKLANVLIGPNIGSDISYLRVFGNQEVESSYSVVPLNPSFYQTDYTIGDVPTSAVTTDYPTSYAEINQINQANGTNYNSADYGAEYATGAYATPEYTEVLRSYQASLNIYNTYADDGSLNQPVNNEVAIEVAEVSSNSTQEAIYNNTANTAPASVANQDYTFRQTITLTGVEPTSVESSGDAVVQAGYAASVVEQQTNIVNNSVDNSNSLNNMTSESSQSTASGGVTSTSMTQPISVAEQSLQSAVMTSPFKSWAALNLENYSFVFQQYCYCSDEYLYEMIVSVENGSVSRVQYLENYADVPSHVFYSVPSIEDIFMGIAEIRVEGLTTVDVAYDQNYSYPNSIYFVNNPQTDTDDVSYQISYFEIQ